MARGRGRAYSGRNVICAPQRVILGGALLAWEGRWGGGGAAWAEFRGAVAAAAGQGAADAGGAGGGGGGEPAVGQRLGAGDQSHRPQGHRGAAGRCARPGGPGAGTVRRGGPGPGADP